LLVRPRPDPFEPASVSMAMHLLALVPAFIAYLVHGSVQLNLLPQVTGRTRIELVQTILFAYALGSVAYYIGYYTSAGKRFANVFPDIAGGTWSRTRVLVVCAGCIALFIPAYVFFQSRVG